MARPKYDGVVEAVHYNDKGQIAWVRAYERRGPTFSDRVLIDRSAFIQRLKSGKRFVIGKRVPQEASTFDISAAVKLIQDSGKEVIVTDDAGDSVHQDTLKNVPLL